MKLSDIDRTSLLYKNADVTPEIVKYFTDQFKILSEDKKFNDNFNKLYIECIKYLHIDQDKFFSLIKEKFEVYNIVERQYFVNYFGWSIPSKEGIIAIATFVKKRNILSIGSGVGLWEFLISKNIFGKIICTDIVVNESINFMRCEILDAVSAVKKYPTPVLLTVWPAQNGEHTYHSLLEFKGKYLIYIGEYRGVTGCSKFHDCLEKCFTIKKVVDLPNFVYTTSKLYLAKRK